MVVETWLKDDFLIKNKEYKVFQKNSTERGKGVLIVVRSSLNPRFPLPELNTETLMIIQINSKIGNAYLIVSYISSENK